MGGLYQILCVSQCLDILSGRMQTIPSCLWALWDVPSTFSMVLSLASLSFTSYMKIQGILLQIYSVHLLPVWCSAPSNLTASPSVNSDLCLLNSENIWLCLFSFPFGLRTVIQPLAVVIIGLNLLVPFSQELQQFVVCHSIYENDNFIYSV